MIDTTFTKQLMGSVKQSNLSFTKVLNENRSVKVKKITEKFEWRNNFNKSENTVS